MSSYCSKRCLLVFCGYKMLEIFVLGCQQRGNVAPKPFVDVTEDELRRMPEREPPRNLLDYVGGSMLSAASLS